jgi:hypothetical protein
MKIEVIHNEKQTTPDRQWLIEDGKIKVVPVHVATVESSASDESAEHRLETAWMRTQNIRGSWSIKDGNPDNHDSVTVRAPLHVVNGETYGLRSSMVGDEFVLDGVSYIVAGCGFEKKEAQ